MRGEGTGKIDVLHVDDDPQFAEMTAQFLEREDDRITVHTAASVSDGLSVLADEPIECVISDYEMPEQTGIEFLETVRKDDPQVPFILYTGNGSEAVASDAISAGVTEYLRKQGGTEQYALLANKVINAVEKTRAQRSQHRQLQAIETAQEGLSILDDDGHFIYVNEAYAALYGYAPDDLVGEHWGVIYPNEETEFVREELLPTVEEDGYWHGETTGLRADGGTFVEDHIVSTTEDGELVCAVRDISDRKRRKTELAETNTVLQTILENLPMGIFVQDASHEIRAVNEEFCDLFESPDPPEELEGRDCKAAAKDLKNRFAAPQDVLTGIQQRLSDRDPVQNEELHLADGRIFERDYIPYTLPDGEANLWIYRDATDRKQQERAVKALHTVSQQFMYAETKEEVAQLAADAAADILDLRINAVYFHDEDANELVPVAWTNRAEDVVPIPTFARGESLTWEAFETKETKEYDDVSEHPDRYKEDTPMRSELILPLGDHGVLLAGTTEQGQFTDLDVSLGELLASNLQAALERADREETLRQRERALEQHNEQLDAFASVLSHDLRNPLQVAEGQLDLAEAECDSDHLAQIGWAHDRMRTLIDDLLALAQEGEVVSEPELIDLDVAVMECWQQAINASEATLVIETGQQIHADKTRLQQLLENLLGNAVEHGGADVTITVGNLEETSGFYVEDDGPGIPVSERDRIFETGYTSHEDGTGFGLRIVEKIADAHGWTVTVTEGIGGGTRFEITDLDPDGLSG